MNYDVVLNNKLKFDRLYPNNKIKFITTLANVSSQDKNYVVEDNVIRYADFICVSIRSEAYIVAAELKQNLSYVTRQDKIKFVFPHKMKLSYVSHKIKLSYVTRQDKIKFVSYKINFKFVSHKIKLSFVTQQDKIKFCIHTR